MKRTMFVLGASALFSTAAMAGSWADSDKNGDGKLTKAEYDAGVTASWTKMDVDKNGQISASEAGSKAAEWKTADANGDGQISQAEFTAKKAAWWAKADADKNGTVSKEEYAAADMDHSNHKG